MQLYKIIIIIALLFAPFCYANSMQDAYTAVIEVSSNNEGNVKRFSRPGLLTVLHKTTGLSKQQLSQYNAIAKALNNADRYIQQYSFIAKPTLDTNRLEQGSYFLQLTFNRLALTQLLQSAGLVANITKPKVLVIPLLASDDSIQLMQPSAVVANGSFTDLRFALINTGISAHIYQSQAISEMRLSALWSLDAFSLNNLKSTHNADAILLLKQTLEGESIGGSVFYADNALALQQPKSRVAAISGSNYMTALQNAFTPITQSWNTNNRMTMGENEVAILIRGLSSFEAYSQLMETVAAIDFIEHVYVLEAQPQHILISAKIKAEKNQLSARLDALPAFQPVSSSNDAAVLEYYWTNRN